MCNANYLDQTYHVNLVSAGKEPTYPFRYSLPPAAVEPASHSLTSQITWPVLVCLLGNFRLLKAGQPVAINGEKAGTFLRCLGLQHERLVSRDWILEALWPHHAPALAGQSLNSLVYSLRKLLSDALCGDPPVLCHDGYYCLNKEAGVGVDIACFEYLVHAGNDEMRANNPLAAADFYAQAVQLYRGDLCMDTEVNTVMERERLRAHFLTTLARLGDYYFSAEDYSRCLHYTERLLEVDPCREDAHRLVMRCYVRQGERAQALRQYHLCQYALHAEFDTMPEPRTALLYDQVRLDPESV